MIPKELEETSSRVLPLGLGEKLDKYLREADVSLKLLRKTHKAVMLESELDSVEANLLQGRLSRVIVAHYIKHI